MRDEEFTKSSCVGWFKLAELIDRKEKEKALSLYRLLSHSFDDKAYSLQLEGDILWSMQDKLAIEKYMQAAFLYKKEKKVASAIGIYEHLLTLQPKNHEFLSTLLMLYVFTSWQEKFKDRYNLLLKLLEDGDVARETVLSITKKIIKKAQQDCNEYGFVKKDSYPLVKKWLTRSIFSALKSRKIKFVKELEEYCLEHNLDFDS